MALQVIVLTIIFAVIFIVSFVFILSSIFNPKFKEKMMERQIRNAKSLLEDNGKLLKDLSNKSEEMIKDVVKDNHSFSNGFNRKRTTACLNCGQAIEKGSTYCKYCGKRQ